MANRFRLYRGLKANLPAANTLIGELRFCTDTNELFIDNGGGSNINLGVALTNGIGSAVQTALNLKADSSALTSYALLDQGTLTTNNPQSHTVTWNNSGVTFTGWKWNVTDTASNSASLLADFQVGGTSKASIDKSGGITAGLGTQASPAIRMSGFTNASSTGFFALNTDNGAIRASCANTQSLTLTNSYLQLLDSVFFGFGAMSGTSDVRLYRGGADILEQIRSTNAQTFNIYNTFTDTSNYERGFIRWNTNTLEIGNEQGGTGSNQRETSFISGGLTMFKCSRPANRNISLYNLCGNTDGSQALGLSGLRWGHSYLTAIDLADTTLSGSGSLAGSILNLAQTWNTTGTPTAIKLNVTDTASASGSFLADFQVGGTSKLSIAKTGYITAVGGILCGGVDAQSVRISGGVFQIGANAGGIQFANFPFGTTDLVLNREAANIFAQRNGTNAQTFNLYGTYTDASNYRRLSIGSTTAGVFSISPTGLGTGVDGNQLTFPLGSVTVNSPMLITQTWNNAATTFTGLQLNVTNTASGASSLLADFQVGGSSKLSIDKTGQISLNGGGAISGSSGAITLTAAGTNQNINLTPSGTGFVVTKMRPTYAGSAYEWGAGQFGIVALASGGGSISNVFASQFLTASSIAGNSQNAQFDGSNGLLLNNTNSIKWSNNSVAGTNSNDIGLFRSAVGVLEVNSGTSGTLRDLKLRDITLSPSASLTPTTNGQLVVEATSNTTLTFKLKGSDGTVRSGTITLA